MNRDEAEASFRRSGFIPDGQGGWTKPPLRERAVLQPRDTGSAPKLERHPRVGTLGQRQIQTGIGGPVLVVVKSFRRRLLDEDNLCCKYHVDLLRYSGIISSDAPGTAKIQVCQEKVGTKDPERTVIEVYRQATVLK